MAVRVELVDHHPVVAEHVAKAAHHAIGQGADAGGRTETLHRVAEQFAQLGGRNVHGVDRRRSAGIGASTGTDHGFDFDQQQGAGATLAATTEVDAMQHAFEPALGPERPQPAAQWHRLGEIAGFGVGTGTGTLHAGFKVAAKLDDWLGQQAFGRHAEQGLHIRTRLDDAQPRLAQRQQQPVGLDRAGQVDQLTFAVGQVRRTEGSARKQRVQSAQGTQ